MGASELRAPITKLLETNSNDSGLLVHLTHKGTMRSNESNHPNPVTLEGIAIFIHDEDEPTLSRIVYVNEAFVRMAGMSFDQLVGHSAILLAGSRPKLHDVRAAMSAPKDRPYVKVHRKTRPDGSEYDAEVRIEPLPQSPGRPQHMVLIQRAL